MKAYNSPGWIDENNPALTFPLQNSPSPHFNHRPDAQGVSLLVLHNISLPPENFTEDYVEQFFLGKLDADIHPYFKTISALKVSAHFFIRRSGNVIQFVSTVDRAWHAGKSSYLGRDECNDFSIGIELEGSDNQPYTEEQYQQLVDLTKLLLKDNPALKPERIVAHSDIAPERKTDPGPFFDWKRFYKQLG